MGAHVKVIVPVVHPSPWDRYAWCKVCDADAGSPCLDLRSGRFPHLRVQPHLARAFESTYRGPWTWPRVDRGEL